MTDQKGARLSKLAKEFNVGINTMLEFLHKKGYVVDSNPNAKVGSDIVSILEKEYSKDLNVKKESEKLDLKNLREKKESISIQDVEKEKPEEEEDVEDNGKEVFIKGTAPSFYSDDTHKKEPELKIVGKVNLDHKNRPIAPSHQSQEPAKHQAQPKPQEEVKAKPVQDQKHTPAQAQHQPPVQKEVKEIEKPVNQEKEIKVEQVVPQEKKEPVAEKVEQVIVQEPVEKPAEVQPQPEIQQKEKEAEKPDAEQYEEAASDEQPVAVETDNEQPQFDLKVVGKIDLDSMNQRTRPAKKPRKEREMERRKKEAQQKAAMAQTPGSAQNNAPQTSGTTNAGTADANFIRAEVKKINGPTVVGKINLPDDKKKPVATSNDAEADKRNKKKRKRIKIEANKPQPASGIPTDASKRPILILADKNAKKPAGNKNGGNNRKPVRQEVNEEDVQKQIKETLARLTANKGKSKASKYRREKRDLVNLRNEEEAALQELEKNILKVTEFVSVNELATMMDVPVTKVISSCMSLGLFVSINQRLDAETMSIVAEEFGYKLEFISVELTDLIKDDDDPTTHTTPRPPIVTVMGHVDHGKTKLLDYIRHSNVISGEAGGITQHIGAYSVILDGGRKITFLDTPGHEAFTAMRARGAQLTDIVIIVVAADDGVMPQTVEAINHAQAAGSPIIFAINKIDKPAANPERIKEELAKMNLLVEDWGGKYQSQEISAKNGLNINLLLEKVLLEAEMLELKADPDRLAKGTVVESSLDKGRGYTSTILVQNGTLRTGDMVVAGSNFGHVKAMFNERGKNVSEAGPATPVLILGLNGAPQAGDKFNVLSDEKEAKDIASKREQLQREQTLRTRKHITLDEIGRRIAIGNFQELNIVVKGDVDGSVEALSDSLIKLSTEEVQVNIIHKAVGQITESDVLLAAASNAIIVGFQVRPSSSARKLAEKEQIDIRMYSIIYTAIEEVKDAMEGMLSPEMKEETVATLEVREAFKITKVGTVAGCMVKEGKITRNSKIRIIRDGIVIHTGTLGSLKRFKDDVKDVTTGFECGLNITNFNDIQVGDLIEGFTETEVKKKL
jgi:translation initiation factor IF-2